MCLVQSYQEGKGESKHHHLGEAIDAGGSAHVGSGERTVVGADKGFVNQLPEVIVRTAEAAVEDARQSRLRITAVGAREKATVFPDK